MKQLTCEMCGGVDLVKQDGVFICQTCGCKYSVEEAKKMMIEGLVDVSGSTIKVDNSAFVEKYLLNARRAKEKEDWEEVEKYYNMVEQNDPDNIEAIFYSAYGKAKTTLVDSDIYKRQAAFKVLKNCISIIDDHYLVERREENKNAIESMAVDLGNMINSDFVFTEWKNGYGTVTKTTKGETYTLFASLLDGFKESIDNIQAIDDQLYLHEALVTLFSMAKRVQWPVGGTIMYTLERWIDEEKEEIRKLKISAYWEENKEERERLDKELEDVRINKKLLEDQINSHPYKHKIEELNRDIEELKKMKNSLGLFKGNEKKVLQDKIQNLTKKIEDMEGRLKDDNAEIAQSLELLSRRENEIENELTKNR